MTVFTIHCQDQYGNPVAGATVSILEYGTMDAGTTDANGDYVTIDLAFPTPFFQSQYYEVVVYYWAATNQPTTLIAWDTPQPVILVLNLYEGQGQEGGLGSKTLTINANPAECNHIIAINVGQQTSEVFVNFPAAFHFNPEDQISLEAFPQSGYQFDDWGGGNNANPYYWYPGDDASISARFHWVGLPPTNTEQVINVPKPIVVFGNVFVPETDIVECKVHLGATKEVSSFEVTVQNWGKKYSPNGWLPIQVGATGGIGICRIPNNPNVLPLISLKVENIKYNSNPVESYCVVSGRCWGERLFAKKVTKKYVNQKGEAIVKDLLDSYIGLSHIRNGVELVENTDTTYTLLDYEDTSVFDILTYIAQTADKNGVIGFDFRVAPDGKFEFFPKNSKTSLVNLTEALESSEYQKDITAVRNKVTIYGAAEKCYPVNQDDWTTIIHPADGDWTAVIGEVAQDNTKAVKGAGSIKCHVVNNYAGSIRFTLYAGKEMNGNLYPELIFWGWMQNTFRGLFNVALIDSAGKIAGKAVNVGADEDWHQVKVSVGEKNADDWSINNGFDWMHIKVIQFSAPFNGVGSGDFWIDSLYFGGRRFMAIEEDTASQNTYGLREYTDTDDELYSDFECSLRAKAVLANLKAPAEILTINSTVIDYGTSVILAGDKIHVQLPNENIDEDFRVVSAEYTVDGVTQELSIKLELGREAPLLADYVYALRSKVDKVNRVKVAK